MKIFIVCSRLGYGGAERVATMWANGFAERGHDVTLISNLYEDITYSIHENIDVRNLVSSVETKRKKWGSALKNVRVLAKEKRPDVIIGVMRVCSSIAKIAVLGMGIPVIATEHNAYEWPKSAPMPLQARLFKYHVSKIFDKVTVLTDADKQLIGKRLKNVFVMPNPLSIVPLARGSFKKNVILAAGRLDAWHCKGFDVLIKAWGVIAKNEKEKVKNEGWRLQIAGVGSEESLNYLEQLCEENGVENLVEFLGFRNDIEKLYQESSIFVLSSRYEGFGLVLIEAMSQGCACIACDYKGRQHEIIQDVTQGLTCDPDSVESLSKALEKMLVDNNYRESVRDNAIERSKAYSLGNIMNLWEKLLTDVVKG